MHRKSKARHLLLGVASLCMVLFFAAAAHAQAAAGTPSVRLFYYRQNADAEASLFQNPTSIDILAPQTYHFDMNAILVGNVDPLVLSFAVKNNIQVMPVVTNGNFDNASLTAILNDPARQAAAIAMLVNEAKAYHYIGWQIDFEQIDVSYRDSFSAFIANTETAFKQNGLKLSVAVIAKTSDTPSDYPNSLWNNLIGAYNYDALASSTDFISIMSYDDPVSTTAVAPYPWLQQVLAYSLKHIPAQKISLGIPLYYWEWNSTTGKRIEIGGYAGLQHALLRPGATLGYDPTQQAPFLTYISGGSIYTIWYENLQSMTQKISLITSNNLLGFSAWSLGLESPDIYRAL